MPKGVWVTQVIAGGELFCVLAKIYIEIKMNMKIFKWILFLPAAFCIQAIVSILFGLIFYGIGLKNQVLFDSINAFVGAFLFVFFAGYLAPSKKTKVAEIIFWIEISLAILNLVLGFLGVYTFVKMETPNSIIPVLQVLGALYAVTLVPILTTQGARLDQLWIAIAGLGGLIMFIGGAISILGIIIGLFSNHWMTLSVGAIVLGMGIITWLYPDIHLFLRVRRANKIIKKMEKGDSFN
ncbi:MAG TPA: hypothetical protein VMR81_00670 [Patescibacteria group bacterium]|nr:hypothetical protein [Patescibacteria group bacterium]